MPSAQRETLPESQIAKATKRRMQEEAKTGDEALIAATMIRLATAEASKTATVSRICVLYNSILFELSN